MIRAEVKLLHDDGTEEGDLTRSFSIVNDEGKYVWVRIRIANSVHQVRLDIDHLEKAVRAIKAGKD